MRTDGAPTHDPAPFFERIAGAKSTTCVLILIKSLLFLYSLSQGGREQEIGGPNPWAYKRRWSGDVCDKF